MKMLIIEDDVEVAEFIRIGFHTEGFVVDTAIDGIKGLFMAKTTPYDILILDNSLPGKTGLEVCEELRKNGSNIPIIFLSALGTTKIKVQALTNGADDYMTKPFSFEELQARVHALLRRPTKLLDTCMTIGDLMLDTEKKMVKRGGREITITKKEYSLLEYLMRNPNIPVSRSMIMEHVWSTNSDPFSNTVEAHITNLRRKLNTGEKEDIIKNIPGRGYLIEE